MLRLFIYLYGLILIIKETNASACSRLATAKNINYARMCYGSNTDTRSVVLDTFDADDSGATQCSCTISLSHGQETMYIKGFQHFNPDSPKCGSVVEIQQEKRIESMPIAYDYRCAVNRSMGLKVGSSSDVTISWSSQKDAVSIDSHYCILFDIGSGDNSFNFNCHEARPLWNRMKSTDPQDSSYTYLIIVPTVLVFIMLVVAIVIIIYCKRKRRYKHRGYHATVEVREGRDTEDLETLGTQYSSEEDSEAEEIIPDEVTYDVKSPPKIHPSTSTHVTVVDEDPNIDNRQHIILKNEDLFHVIAPSGDPYAKVQKVSRTEEPNDEELFSNPPVSHNTNTKELTSKQVTENNVHVEQKQNQPLESDIDNPLPHQNETPPTETDIDEPFHSHTEQSESRAPEIGDNSSHTESTRSQNDGNSSSISSLNNPDESKTTLSFADDEKDENDTTELLSGDEELVNDNDSSPKRKFKVSKKKDGMLYSNVIKC